MRSLVTTRFSPKPTESRDRSVWRLRSPFTDTFSLICTIHQLSKEIVKVTLLHHRQNNCVIDDYHNKFHFYCQDVFRKNSKSTKLIFPKRIFLPQFFFRYKQILNNTKYFEGGIGRQWNILNNYGRTPGQPKAKSPNPSKMVLVRFPSKNGQFYRYLLSL